MQPANLKNDQYIYLYAAKGVGPISLKQAKKSFDNYLGKRSVQLISITDPSYFQNPYRMTSAAAVIFPGGSAWEMSGILTSKGIEGIKYLVEHKKVSYIGFCAGAYLANKSEYLMDSVLMNLDFGLTFSKDNILYGPAYPLNCSVSLETAKAIPIKTCEDDKVFHVYWNGGGYYKYTDEKSIATYKEVDRGSGVAVMKFINRSIVVSNVHPEIRLTSDEIETYFPHLNNKKEYLASAPQQEQLFNQICQSVGI